MKLEILFKFPMVGAKIEIMSLEKKAERKLQRL